MAIRRRRPTVTVPVGAARLGRARPAPGAAAGRRRASDASRQTTARTATVDELRGDRDAEVRGRRAERRAGDRADREGGVELRDHGAAHRPLDACRLHVERHVAERDRDAVEEDADAEQGDRAERRARRPSARGPTRARPWTRGSPPGCRTAARRRPTTVTVSSAPTEPTSSTGRARTVDRSSRSRTVGMRASQLEKMMPVRAKGP